MLDSNEIKEEGTKMNNDRQDSNQIDEINNKIVNDYKSDLLKLFKQLAKMDKNIIIVDCILFCLFVFGLVMGLVDPDLDSAILVKVLFSSIMGAAIILLGFSIKTDIKDYKKTKMIVKSLQ